MTLDKYLLVFLSTLGLASGQIFLKLAVDNISIKLNSFEILRLFLNKYLLLSICMFILSFVIWAYLLSQFPVSKIYPFFSLAFVIVPILAFIFLGEDVGTNVFVGSTIIFVGLIVLRYDF